MECADTESEGCVLKQSAGKDEGGGVPWRNRSKEKQGENMNGRKGKHRIGGHEERKQAKEGTSVE